MERLSVDGDGLVMLELKRAFTDGTTHVLFEPEDFIARLAALVPRPRAHLLRYHGLFIPGILPSTLRVSLRLLKIAPGDFVELDDFVAKFAALVSKPRVNLTRYL